MTANLSILVPTPITDALLTSSTIAETDYTAYSSATTYGLGVRCIAAHRIFESQIAGNIDHDPTDPINQFGTIVYWLDVGPTNRWAMFDNEISSQTTATSTMTVVLHPGNFNTVYYGGLEAGTLSMTVKDAPGGTVIFTYSGTLEGSAPPDYYEWCFDPFSPLRSKIVPNIPAYHDMELSFTLSSGGGAIVKCGVVAVGLLKILGTTQQGAQAQPKTYSYVATDKYGKTTIKKGKSATDITASALINPREARTVQNTIEDVLGVPCMLSCSDSADYSGLNGFGLVSGKVTYKTAESSEVSITQEGLI